MRNTHAVYNNRATRNRRGTDFTDKIYANVLFSSFLPSRALNDLEFTAPAFSGLGKSFSSNALRECVLILLITR